MSVNNNVVFAAAGNGKTYSICAQAISLAQKTDKDILLVTYTNEGVASLENEYRKQNYGIIDANVKITTWFSFLLSEFIRPYQCLLHLKYKKGKNNEISITIPENYVKSIAFYQTEVPVYYNQTHLQYYLNSGKDIFKDRVSLLACLCEDHSKGKAIARLETMYSHVFFDELQDYAGWDLEILMKLFASNIVVTCVGDYKQATFRTNNSPKYKQYRDDKIKLFFEAQSKKGLCCIKYENTTRRFNQEICDYINTIYNDTESKIIPCPNSCAETADNTGVYIIDIEYADLYCKYYSPTVLRYDKRTVPDFQNYKEIFNYGNSKGATFERVAIIPVGTVLPFVKNGTAIKAAQTRSKFYVACTRARHSVVFFVDSFSGSALYVKENMKVGDITIPVYKFKK